MLELQAGFISKAAFLHTLPSPATPHHCCRKLCFEPCIFFDTLCSWRNTPNYCGCVLRDCNVSWHFQDVSFFEKGISTRRVKRLIFQTWKLSLAPLSAGEAWTHCLVGSIRRPGFTLWACSAAFPWGGLLRMCKRVCTSTHTHPHTSTPALHYTHSVYVRLSRIPDSLLDPNPLLQPGATWYSTYRLLYPCPPPWESITLLHGSPSVSARVIHYKQNKLSFADLSSNGIYQKAFSWPIELPTSGNRQEQRKLRQPEPWTNSRHSTSPVRAPLSTCCPIDWHDSPIGKDAGAVPLFWFKSCCMHLIG